MRKEKILAIKEQANLKILDIFDKLGIDYRERYQYVYAACPIHEGDNESGWSWHLELGMFRCYTRGCHEDNGKDIFSLIRGINKCGFIQAVRFVEKICEFSEEDMRGVIERNENKKFVMSVKKEKRNQRIYPEECLNKLIYHDYLETRGFPKELIEKYQIGLGNTPYKKMHNRIVFPVRNIDGNLVGFTGRDITGNGPKWIHSYDFDSRSNLFNIDSAKDHIMKTGTALIVEGPIDVLRFEQAGIHNSVAIFGRAINNGQIGLLMKTGANKLIFALDDDKAGKTGTERGFKMAGSFFDVSKVEIGGGRDVGDLTPSEVREKFYV